MAFAHQRKQAAITYQSPTGLTAAFSEVSFFLPFPGPGFSAPRGNQNGKGERTRTRRTIATALFFASLLNLTYMGGGGARAALVPQRHGRLPWRLAVGQ